MRISTNHQIVLSLVIIFQMYKTEGFIIENNDQKPALNIAVIGAGASGLVSTKHAIDLGYNVTIYEQNDHLGGVWAYSEQTGKNKYGINIHSSMYKGLRTNTPYQTLAFPHFHQPNGSKSFVSHTDILKFLHSYADHFDMNKYIKFNHLVIRVQPTENGKWEIIVKDLPNDKFTTAIYDAVFICNGHYFSPRKPEIEGAAEFKGKMIHSREFRRAETFKDDDVLVIGTSSSGRDLMVHLSKVAKSVTYSRKKPMHETKEEREKLLSSLPPNVILQDNVKRFTANAAQFIDGTQQTFTAVIFATGYNYSFPFLSVETGIHIDDNFVQPLYKHIINIERPTMAFIGIPMSSINFFLFDLQVRFAMKFLSGAKKLPSRQEMLEDWRIQTEKHWNKGFRKHQAHVLLFDQRDYANELSTTAEIDNFPEVMNSLAVDAGTNNFLHPTEFRKYNYTIIDDKTFTKEKIEN